MPNLITMSMYMHRTAAMKRRALEPENNKTHCTFLIILAVVTSTCITTYIGFAT
jgi:hypothetical protein